MTKRIRMCLRLNGDNGTFPETLRHVEIQYLHAMAEAVLDAYRDTVDYEGEDLDQTMDELTRVFNDYYGPLLTEASFLIMEKEEVKAGVLVCLYRNEPTITYTFTRKKEQRLGYATLLIMKAADVLYRQGHHSLYLYVTVENSGALRLYESLGFSEVPTTTISEINVD